jgi:hypothetical protein
MGKPRIHWQPRAPISYPSGRNAGVRTFVMKNAPSVCFSLGETSANIDEVTCLRCRTIYGKCRFDTLATVTEVLSRGGCTAPPPSEIL